MDGLFNISQTWLLPMTQWAFLANSQATQPEVSAAVVRPEWQQTLVDYGYGPMVVLGIFVVPFIISHFVTKWLRMPTLSFRLGVMLASVIGALLFASASDFKMKLGPDMKGGTTLIYDIMPDDRGEQMDAGALATALSDRINPSGTKEISIRPRGGDSQIEITVPMVQDFELQQIKDLLANSGQLEFRIVANGRDHDAIIQQARAQATANTTPKREVLDTSGNPVGRWFMVGRDDELSRGSDGDLVLPFKTPVLGDVLRNSVTGQIINVPALDFQKDYALETWLRQQGISQIDVLMALQLGNKPYAEVMGDDLDSAAMEFDKQGEPTVAFRLTPNGAQNMVRLTSINQPTGEFKRRMAIIMDGKVLSAPTLNSPISSQGQITGRFTRAEVEFLVTILRSGRLPATLSDQPVSDYRVGAGLGATTIQKGTTASIAAVIATFVSILLYYRFAGVLASVALVINGLLIFGVMIFIGQPLTLPGLAGLVLTVGMSVDANVLIFERIREEKAKGSAPRMSIRNGFDRAFATIVDSNLTTLIAAVVLYWIGTDQVRGFAVALIIGIATSMFTATFCSRLMFEIAERLRVVNLSMADGIGFFRKTFLGDKDIDFMSRRAICVVASGIMLSVGLVAIFARGKELLNIDFIGGTSVTFQLQEPVEAERLRAITKEILSEDEDGKPVQSTLVRVEKDPADTVYTLVTSIEKQDFLSKQLMEGFSKNNSANLVTYRLKVAKPTPATSDSGWWSQPSWTRLVGYQEPEQTSGSNSPTPASEEVLTPEAPATSTTEDDLLPSGSDEAPPAAAVAEVSTEQDTADTVDATTPAEMPSQSPDEAQTAALPPVQTKFLLEFLGSQAADEEGAAKYAGPTLKEQLLAAAVEVGNELNPALVEVAPDPRPEGWNEEDVSGYAKWLVSLPVDDKTANQIIGVLEDRLQQQPLWLSLSSIGTRVADEMQQRAIAALLVSLIFIVGYIWFRFQKISYGLAAVAALVHDVVITLGIVALCHWLSGPLGFLLIEDFKIGLTEVAAILTIIGYSLNDTIVVFDRIREVRGRSPRLNAAMVNLSVNQTLSRTLLTSGTTLLTVVLLYVFGGEGIHAFSFALLIGILVGTYSSIFIAAPMLLWLTNRESSPSQQSSAAA